MVLLLTDVFLLLTQVLLWIVVGLITWYVLLKTLPRAFLSLLVLLLILIVLALSFFRGPPVDGGVLEALWRIISFPFSPLGLGLVLLLILLSGTKLTKLARNVILTILILLMLGTFPIVSYFLAQELEMEGIEQVRAQQALPAGARRVIVLLGQNTTRPQLRPPRDQPPPSPPPVERPVSPDAFQILTRLPTQITEQGDRIVYAAQLFDEETRAGNSPLVLVSANLQTGRLRKEGEEREDVSEARVVQTMLTQTFGVPETSILLDDQSPSIRASAENVRRVLNDRGINFGNQLTLVGTAMNMNRAILTFERLFGNEVQIYARPTDFYTLPSADRLRRQVQGRDLIEREVLVTDFVPMVDAFYVSSKAIEEYLAAFYYFLRGWIRPLQGR